MENNKSLIHHLLGETRTAILATLLLRREESRHVRDLERTTGLSPGSLHRELTALVALEVLRREQVGRQVFYRANPACPVLPELTGLLRKTAGLVDVLREGLHPLADRIVVLAIQSAQEALGREINPTVLSREEFEKRRAQADGFFAAIWKEPKLWLLGNADELG